MHLNDDSANQSQRLSVGHVAIDKDGDRAEEAFSCASVVGQLNCLQGHSLPDITMAVSQAARCANQPKRSHELALICIGQHLKGTAGKGLVFKPSMNDKLQMDVEQNWIQTQTQSSQGLDISLN